MDFKILHALDIENHKEEMVILMEMVLRDNITQNYPSNQAEEYVKKIPRYIDDGSAIVTGAFANGNLVGFSWGYELTIFGERRVHIDMIGVDQDSRKRGIAKKLIELQIDETRKRGIRIIEAMITRDNENSYNWFRSMGFNDERIKVRRDLE